MRYFYRFLMGLLAVSLAMASGLSGNISAQPVREEWPFKDAVLKKMVMDLSRAAVREIVECDFENDSRRYFAVVDKHNCLYVLREEEKINKNKERVNEYTVVLRYEDKFSYFCDGIVQVEGIEGLVTYWGKNSDGAMIIFGNRNGKIVPIFKQLGGVFTTEFADVNSDGLTDVLITQKQWVKIGDDHERRPQTTTIFLCQRSAQGNRFVLAKRVPWKQRWNALTRQRKRKNPPQNPQKKPTLFISSPLWVANDKRLILTIPEGWRVTVQDDEYAWKTRQYDFSLASKPLPAASRRGKYVRPPLTLRVSVLMHPLSWAKRHGDLDGEKFRTNSGLTGFFIWYDAYEGERDWRCTLLTPDKEGILLFICTGKRNTHPSLEPVVRSLLKSVRLRK